MKLLPATTDLWAAHADGSWVVIPTNTTRKGDGTAVMGAGLALAAATRWPTLPARYGRALADGHDCLAVPTERLLLIPTKRHWRHPSTVRLVHTACDHLLRWAATTPAVTVTVPALGCGHGGLAWDVVRPLLAARLPGDRWHVIPPR